MTALQNLDLRSKPTALRLARRQCPRQSLLENPNTNLMKTGPKKSVKIMRLKDIKKRRKRILTEDLT